MQLDSLGNLKIRGDLKNSGANKSRGLINRNKQKKLKLVNVNMVLTIKQIAILKKACNRSCPLKVMRQVNSAFGSVSGSGDLPRRRSISSASRSSVSDSDSSSETSSGSGGFYGPNRTYEDIWKHTQRRGLRKQERRRRRAEQARAAERARAAPPVAEQVISAVPGRFIPAAPPAQQPRRRDVLPFSRPPAAPPASLRDFPPFSRPPALPAPPAPPAPPAQSKVGEDRALAELSDKVDSLYDDVANISEHLFKKHLAGLKLNIRSKEWLQEYPDLTGALLSKGQGNEALWNDFFGKFSTAMKEHQSYEKSLMEARYIQREIEKIFFPARG